MKLFEVVKTNLKEIERLAAMETDTREEDQENGRRAGELALQVALAVAEKLDTIEEKLDVILNRPHT